MTNRHMRMPLAAGLALACLAGGAGAEQAVDARATALGDNISTLHRVGASHALVWTVTEFDPLEADDAESPFDGLGGPCFGQLEIEDEAVSGGGYCTWTDGEGDGLVARWTATAVGEDTASSGAWTVVGGSGKWDGATGGGTYALSVDLATGRRVNRIEGEATLR